MLMQIHISNLITIDKLLLEFSAGTTVITGETGTGKSILIDAIELALGARASEHMVRPGQEKADISLCFDTGNLPAAKTWLARYDLAQDSQECIIRRTISNEGRSRSYINGMPTTLQLLRELSELLIDFHSQHEHQSLLKSEKQRDMLDDFANHASLVDQVRTLAKTQRILQDKMDTLLKRSEEHIARSEFLSFQLHELQELQLNPNEFQALDLEHKQLAHAGELSQNIHLALQHLIDNEEHNASQSLNQALQALQTIQHVDPKITAWVESIEAILIQVNDTKKELHHYFDAVELDPSRLAWIDERISILFNLARKHKISPDALWEFQEKLSIELDELKNSDQHLDQLKQQLTVAEKNYRDAAQVLSQSRAKAAKKLADEITTTIRKLALPHAEFQVVLEQEATSVFPSHGLDKIIFQIKTNAGQAMQPLAKIVSGGELSRISLAIHIATAEQHTISTLIFDEADVGISGGTAEIVGKLLRRLGNTHQVLCITHLPQVAAQGHHHLRVEKTSTNDVTHTAIQALTTDEKIDEIARMLGGIAITEKTMAHAREMLENIAE